MHRFLCVCIEGLLLVLFRDHHPRIRQRNSRDQNRPPGLTNMPSSGRRSRMAIPLVLVTMAVAVWPSSAHLVNIMPAQLENGEPGLNVTFTLDDLLDTPINVIVHLEARINVAREDGKHIPALAEIIGPNQPVLKSGSGPRTLLACMCSSVTSRECKRLPLRRFIKLCTG